jgi:Zn-dependent peptidase ImmA (M78 family)/transcriptional regulator with XRE-family HTH domain
MTVGERIKQVRELRGLTQAELAARLSVDQSFVANLEAGRRPLPDQTLKALSFQSEFPPAFFCAGETPEFPEGSLAFRAHSGVPRRSKMQAYRSAQLAFELASSLIAQVNPVKVRLPRIEGPPSEAAAVFRSELGISPERPIPNVLRALEKLGAIVIVLPTAPPGIFAFSLWAGANQEYPIITLIANQSGDRQRFNGPHEARLLTKTPTGTPRAVENDAHRFACELLFPSRVARDEIRTPVTLASLASLKAKWGMSIQALVRHAYELKIITQRQYAYLNIQIRQKGWRTVEPVHVPAERPRALSKMAELVYGSPPDYRAIARNSALPIAFVKQILEPAINGSSGPAESADRVRVVDLKVKSTE